MASHADLDSIISKHTEEMKLVLAENDLLRKRIVTDLGTSEEALDDTIRNTLGEVSGLPFYM